MESQVIRLIKAPSLLAADSKGYSHFPGTCYEGRDQWCVPPSKVKNYVRLKELVGKLRDTEMRDPEQPIPLPPLHEAVSRYDAPLVHSLLERGANPNDPDSKGRTALMLATFVRSMKIVQILLDAGANPNLKAKDGNTSLTFAIPGRPRGSISIFPAKF